MPLRPDARATVWAQHSLTSAPACTPFSLGRQTKKSHETQPPISPSWICVTPTGWPPAHQMLRFVPAGLRRRAVPHFPFAELDLLSLEPRASIILIHPTPPNLLSGARKKQLLPWRPYVDKRDGAAHADGSAHTRNTSSWPSFSTLYPYPLSPNKQTSPAPRRMRYPASLARNLQSRRRRELTGPGGRRPYNNTADFPGYHFAPLRPLSGRRCTQQPPALGRGQVTKSPVVGPASTPHPETITELLNLRSSFSVM
ncbi:hypothetical protein B0T18DRAFT_96824 [Schizothecium vesticola]|uniref:Uncharacterized protein n=1 Tax=Schizothecium vesticola TaxID=314040 RepID=A0AA40F0X8_9PEZI|nr:hypothetical protein B0T18DRAFT_96824 [Schizothecium vesticola]